MNPLRAAPEFFNQAFEAVAMPEESLTDVAFYDCAFVGCSFREARLTRCRFLDCRFTRCDLSNVILNGSTFRDATFEQAKLLGVNWSVASLGHPTFVDCLLDYGVFVGLDLRKAVFRQCQAREIELGDANLTESVAIDTDFAGARFHHTNLARADWRGASNYALRPTDNTLKKARFALPEAIALLHGLDIELDG